MRALSCAKNVSYSHNNLKVPLTLTHVDIDFLIRKLGLRGLSNLPIQPRFEPSVNPKPLWIFKRLKYRRERHFEDSTAIQSG